MLGATSDKKSLRKEIIEKRDSVNAGQRAEFENRIFNNLISYPVFAESQTVLIYYSVKGEIDTQSIIDRCFLNGKKVALPVCGKNGKMDFYYIKSRSDLISGKYGIPAPDTAKCEAVEEFSRAICVVPALCFDKRGARLGYGGGFYDRFLSEHSVKTAGLCFSGFLFDEIPCEQHDVLIDAVITENGVINF